MQLIAHITVFYVHVATQALKWLSLYFCAVFHIPSQKQLKTDHTAGLTSFLPSVDLNFKYSDQPLTNLTVCN